MRKILLVQSVFFLFIAAAHAVNDRALFWQVQSDTAKVYLLGSIHFADESFYPLRNKIEQAFNTSDYLVVEINIDEDKAQKYRELMQQQGS